MDKKSLKSVTSVPTPVRSAMNARFTPSETSSDSFKSTKTTYSFMDKRCMYTIIEDALDVTPEAITVVDYPMLIDLSNHAAFRNKIKQNEGKLKSAKSLHDTADTGMKAYATSISLDDIRIDHTSNTEEGAQPDDGHLSLAPSAFYLTKTKSKMAYPPEFLLILKETETVYLYELPSYSCEKGTTEAVTVEQENEFYQYITVGKGRNRRMIHEETQTQSATTQTRHTFAPRPQKKNATTFASLWDMHDTYAKLAKKTVTKKEDEMVMYQSVAPSFLRKSRHMELDPGANGDRLGFQELAKTQRFLDAVLLVERVLSTQEYSNQQKNYRGLVKIDPLALDLKYIYSLKHLWTFESADTINRPIVCISFNPKNENILAVGHGKFGYAENHSGVVCIWCTKNPCNYERIYKFDHPLTSLCFSETNPNWLACGFANGDVIILDVTSYDKKVLARSKRETNPSFEPIWTTMWKTLENPRNEYVVTTCQDGRISRFKSTKTHDFICAPMMRLCSVEGKVKGLEVSKPGTHVDVPITRHPAALCTQWHPNINHVYLVGTDEGYIHRCSTHYLNQHMDVFRAHTGPVYDMQYSPFLRHLLVSCGADYAIRLWVEGVDDVIMTLTCSAAVYGVTFCPMNATILISISGNAVSVWDLRRKTHVPCAEYTFPGSVVLTYVRFTASGDNVIVSDTAGRVHTFHLEDVPIAPFNQKKMLDDAIKKALCTRPKLLRQLEKLQQFRQ